MIMSSSTSSQPFSLFQSCIQFVSTNLDIVESLEEFPAQVAVKIYEIGIWSKRWLNETNYRHQGLQLFTEAFGEEMLSSLNLSGC